MGEDLSDDQIFSMKGFLLCSTPMVMKPGPNSTRIHLRRRESHVATRFQSASGSNVQTLKTRAMRSSVTRCVQDSRQGFHR
ncbi:hypothetical protein RYX36_022869 [Vicia faba]